MYVVYSRSLMGRPTISKCVDIPVTGDGKPIRYLQKHQIKPNEEGLTLTQLEKLYPYVSKEL